MQGHVAVSHAYALGSVRDDVELPRTAEALREAGVAIMTNAPGEGDDMPPVRSLREAGVTIFAGSDNIRDSWWPYGNGDMLERATLVGYVEGLNTDAELATAYAMATHEAAGVLGIERYGLAPGMRADLVAITAGGVAEAVATHPAAHAHGACGPGRRRGLDSGGRHFGRLLGPALRPQAARTPRSCAPRERGRSAVSSGATVRRRMDSSCVAS